MESRSLRFAKDYYQAPQKKYWKGRETTPEIGNQYWYQEIELIDFNNLEKAFLKGRKPDVALLGYACDEGVRRNLGRIGAKKGATALRQQLSRLPFHHGGKTLADFGDIKCENTKLEVCQMELSKAVNILISNAVFPIIIGGGHDVAYGHLKGVWASIKNTQKPKIGIINFDAHFDLRPSGQVPNSGTPFNQILKEHQDCVNYFILGVQEQSNTKELFDIAKKYQVEYLLNYECILSNFETVKNRLSAFLDQIDYLYITIDMDGFSSAYAPGVSAPSPMGFRPYFVLKTLKYLLDSQKVISCDIAELNPDYDRDHATSNLVARIVDFIVSNLKLPTKFSLSI